MNREILFRRMYRHRKTGQIRFVEWGIIDAKDRSPALMLFWEAILDEQYTGLQDVNGLKIFEGDVLQSVNGIAYVVWDGTGFALKSPGSEAVDWHPSAYYKTMEIIGNIHDNPELL